MHHPMPVEKNLRVLLLEDYLLDAELVRREINLAHPNWLVEHVESKQAFISAIKKEEPDVIISDYSLPQFNGIEAFLTIKNLGLEIPFIMITGQLPEETIMECIKEGVDDYVIKSSLKRLSIAIDNALQRKQDRSERQTMADSLEWTERKFKNIFRFAGVAICEVAIPNIEKIKSKAKSWRKATLEDMQEHLREFEIIETNEEMLNLFAITSIDLLNEKFDQLFIDESVAALRFVFRQLARDSEQIEEKMNMNTLETGKVYVRFKAVQTSRTKSHYIFSFIDLTDVRRSEDRLNKVIQRMEALVEHRTEELSVANNELTFQAKERERINALMRDNYVNMTESIIAAKRIQQLMLPQKQSIADVFADVFIYLRPKDIVSGDFYWFYGKDNRCWIAGVDCTGHGVPGAFMSMIGSNLLNQSVIANQTMSTAAIMDDIDKHVIRELKQHEQGTEVSTGMDLSLCSFDFDTMEMRFTGAFHQLYLMRDGELHQFKGDRYPLGGTFLQEKFFTEHIIPIQKGDCIYMTTDGFMDQFGGPKNKKFTRKRFIQLLHDIQGNGMYDQEMLLKSALQDWKGTYEQIDDILVIGLKI